MRSRSKCTVLAAVVSCFVLLFRFASFDSQSFSRVRKLQARPVIYTFFNPLLEDAFVTEMSPAGDEALVDYWKQSWEEAGWEPRVLTLQDARQHPEYDALATKLDGTLLDGYNKMCIWRWVAMAQAGGGWMADYDTFPLRDFTHLARPLPNDGELSVHDRRVPDLVSGSSAEWIRLAHAILQSLLEKDALKRDELARLDDTSKKPRKRKQYTAWSDMMALHEWATTKPNMYKTDSMVMIRAFDQPDEALGQPWSPTKCMERTPPDSIYAVHFAHAALKKAIASNLLRPGQTMDDRAAIAKEWLQVWKQSCSHVKSIQ